VLSLSTEPVLFLSTVKSMKDPACVTDLQQLLILGWGWTLKVTLLVAPLLAIWESLHQGAAWGSSRHTSGSQGASRGQGPSIMTGGEAPSITAWSAPEPFSGTSEVHKYCAKALASCTSTALKYWFPIQVPRFPIQSTGFLYKYCAKALVSCTSTALKYWFPLQVLR
jgi:hypothetical protein